LADHAKTMQKLHRGNDTMLEGLKPPPNRIFVCRVSQVLDELDQPDKEILIQALSDQQSWPHRTLSNALRERGVSLADTTIARHRQLICQCRERA
jgi:hypothetical protein